MPQDTIDEKINALAIKTGDVDKKLISGLEVIDSTVVHTSGNEEIRGIKTFKNDLNDTTIGSAQVSLLGIRHKDLLKGTPPSSTNYACIFFLDDSNALGNNWEGRMSSIESTVTNNTSTLRFVCFKNDGNITFTNRANYTNTTCEMVVGYDANDIPHARCPSTSENRSTGTDILTRDWIPKDTRIVHTTTDETITGQKIFTKNIHMKLTNCALVGTSTGIDANGRSATNLTHGIDIYNTNGVLAGSAKFQTYTSTDDKITFTVRVARPGALSSMVYLSLENHADGSNELFANDGATNLGLANKRWKQLFASTATISTSDERYKSNIQDVSDTLLDAWGEVSFKTFQFNDAVEEKGSEEARIHIGLIAQQIKSVFEKHGLNPFKYGLLCYDKWEAEEEQKDEQGNIITQARPAGDRYSLRYEECMCLEAAYQRRELERIKAILNKS